MKAMIPLCLGYILILFTNSMFGQDYYSSVTEIEYNNYKYNVSREKFVPSVIKVENASNTMFDTPWYYKGTMEPVNVVVYSQASAELANEGILYDLIRVVLSNEEIKAIKEEFVGQEFIKSYLSLQAVISTSTGYIIELRYYIRDSQKSILAIHPDKLYKLENLIKENAIFKIEPIAVEHIEYVIGKNLNVDLRKL